MPGKRVSSRVDLSVLSYAQLYTISEALFWPSAVRCSASALPPGVRCMTSTPRAASVHRLWLLWLFSCRKACPNSRCSMPSTPGGRCAGVSKQRRIWRCSRARRRAARRVLASQDTSSACVYSHERDVTERPGAHRQYRHTRRRDGEHRGD